MAKRINAAVINNVDEMNAAYQEHFREPYPARTTVAVAALPLGAAVEIELTARRREEPG